MGCEQSVCDSCGCGKTNICCQPRTHPLIQEGTPQKQKVKALEQLRKNDRFITNNLIKQLTPNCNLRNKGANYTFLHAACQFNAYNCVTIICHWVKKNMGGDYTSFVNIPDRNGNTPAMLCARFDSPEALHALLSEGNVELDYVNDEDQSVDDISRVNSIRCTIVLQNQIDPSKIGELNEKSYDDKKEQRKKKNKFDLFDKFNKKKNKKAPRETEFPERDEANALLQQIMRQTTRAKDVIQEEEKIETDTSRMHQSLVGVTDEKRLNTILHDCIKKDINWDDPGFPHNLQSICTKKTHECYQDFVNAVWARPHEIFKCDYDNIHLFNGVDPNDIAQGILGVCYFLCGLSALAEFPEKMRKIFNNYNSNKYGVYSLNFFVQGIPTEITVDDYFPCQKISEDKVVPLFCKPQDNELWALLAEKAWAKLFGTYEVTEAGFMDEAFEYLLGTPAFRYVTDDYEEDEFWKLIYEADQENSIIAAATKSTASKEVGLVANHAYSLISAHEEQGHRILKLRNPWGKFEWNGDFSDKSDCWTEELKEIVGFVEEDDGIFFMNISDFRKHFSYISTGMKKEGWHYNYIKGVNHDKHADYFRFVVSERSEIYLRVHLLDARFKDPGYDYPQVDFSLALAAEDGTFTMIEPDMDKQHTYGRSVYPVSYKQLLLEPGEYVARVKVAWQNADKQREYTLSAYSPYEIDFNKDWIPDFMKQLCLGTGAVSEDEVKEVDHNCILKYGYCGHNAYVYIENRGNKHFTVEISYSDVENYELGKSGRVAPDKAIIEAGPGENNVAYIKKIDHMKGCSYKFGISMNWR